MGKPKRTFTQHILSQAKFKNPYDLNGDAQQLSVSSIIPHPFDYEKYMSTMKTSILSDPLRDLILFPNDCIEVVQLPYTPRLPNAGIPRTLSHQISGIRLETQDSLIRQSMVLFTTKGWTHFHRTCDVYRGNFCQLPRNSQTTSMLNCLIEHEFAVDAIRAATRASETESIGSRSIRADEAVGPPPDVAMPRRKTAPASVPSAISQSVGGDSSLMAKSNGGLHSAEKVSEQQLQALSARLCHDKANSELTVSNHSESQVKRSDKTPVTTVNNKSASLPLPPTVCDIRPATTKTARQKLAAVCQQLATLQERQEIVLVSAEFSGDKGDKMVSPVVCLGRGAAPQPPTDKAIPSSVRNDASAKSNYLSVTIVKSALQTTAQDNEDLIQHNLQKNRINLLTAHYTVRKAYEQSSQCLKNSNMETPSSTEEARPGRPSRLGHAGFRSFFPFPDRNNDCRRILMTCLEFRCSPPGTSGGSKSDNAEPFFVTFFLMNSLNGRRLSENFHWNPNTDAVEAMLPGELFSQPPWANSASGNALAMDLPSGVRSRMPPPSGDSGTAQHLGKLIKCRSALFSVPWSVVNNGTCPLHSIYLVVRVDKVLSGSVTQALEHYTRSSGAGNPVKGHRNMSSCCRSLGRYLMPFAWGARPLTGKSRQLQFYKLEPSRIEETAFGQMVQTLARVSTETGNSGSSSGSDRNRTVEEVMERTYRIPPVPIHLEVAVSELVPNSDGGSDSSLSLPNIMSPDLQVYQLRDFPTTSTTDANVGSCLTFSVPPSHPNLLSDGQEVIREVEHFFDINTDSAAYSFGRRGNAAGDDILSDTGDANDQDSIIPTTVGNNFSGNQTTPNPGLPTFSTLSGAPANSPASSTKRGRSKVMAGAKLLPGTAPEVFPLTHFVNTLYVTPKHVNLAVRHNFVRARNLTCFIELRSSDTLSVTSTCNAIFTRPSRHRPVLGSWINTTVLHHDTQPHFNEQAKVQLPFQLTDEHHLFFRFYHIGVDTVISGRESRGKKQLETSTGFAWLPVLTADGNLNSGTFHLPIASEIQPGYLQQNSIRKPTGALTEPTGVSWLENGRPLFTVHLDCLSSVYTKDDALSRFFQACDNNLWKLLSMPVPPPKTLSRVSFANESPENQPQPGSSLHRTESQTAHTCGTGLAVAIKTLLLIKPTTLVNFLPQLLNQFNEIVLVCASVGHRWACECKNGSSDGSEWLDCSVITKSSGTHPVNEVFKAVLGTLSVLITGLNSYQPSDLTGLSDPCHRSDSPQDGRTSHPSTGPSNKARGNLGAFKHSLLRSYVQYVFDADQLVSNCFAAATAKEPHGTPNTPSKQRRSDQLFPLPPHHALTRGLILILLAGSRAQQSSFMLAHLMENLWFPLALIVKSMTQHLVKTQKLKGDKSNASRFPTLFIEDLNRLIKLIGIRVAVPDGAFSSIAAGVFRLAGGEAGDHSFTVSSPVSSGHNSPTSSLDLSFRKTLGCRRTCNDSLIVSPMDSQATVSFSGVLVIVETARFLSELLYLMDRGYVMQRMHDLMSILVVSPRMSVSEIDRLNELRYQLLTSLSEHEFFVQLNLPSLVVSDSLNFTEPYLQLSVEFRQDHFLVGCILAEIACLLAGCLTTGSWVMDPNNPSWSPEISSAAALYRRPITLLRDILAKHSLDPRYAGSRTVQARIAMLYLPLVRLVLENMGAIGPPSCGLQAAVGKCGVRPSFEGSAAVTSVLRPAAPVAGGKTSSSVSMISDRSAPELVSTGSSSDGESSASTWSSKQYLDEHGRVEQNVLQRIAGLNEKSHLRQVLQERRHRGSACSSSNMVSAAEEVSGSRSGNSHLSGSTLTLTSLDEAPVQSRKTGDDIRMVDDDEGAFPDVSNDWVDLVLTLAGVLSIGSPSRQRRAQEEPLAQQLQKKKQKEQSPSRSSDKTGIYSDSTATDSPLEKLIRRRASSSSSRVHQHQQRTSGSVVLKDRCQQDLFVCLLHILASVGQSRQVALYRSFTIHERLQFLRILLFAVQHLRYRGRQHIQQFENISRTAVKRTPNQILLESTPGRAAGKQLSSRKKKSGTDQTASGSHNSSRIDADTIEFKIHLEANLATEAGLTVVDILQIFSSVFKLEFETNPSTDEMLCAILEVYLSLLENNPSDLLVQRSLSGLCDFVNNFNKVLFAQSAGLLGSLFLEGLRCANRHTDLSNKTMPPAPAMPKSGAECPTIPIKLKACQFVYTLWKMAYETYQQAGFRRAHLQTIVATSKLVSELGPEFDQVLAVLQSLVETNLHRSGTIPNREPFWTPVRLRDFSEGVQDLLRRMRTVLMATSEMRWHKDDHERLVDLTYYVARSYSNCPQLRRTWIDELAKRHQDEGSLAELAMTRLHRAALMAECLKMKGDFPRGCRAFSSISDNIVAEESGLLDASALIDVSYSLDDLLTDVHEAAAALQTAGYYELIHPVLSIIIPVYETRRDHFSLAHVYKQISRAYELIWKAEAKPDRQFGSFFLVRFFGKVFDSMANKAFIYRTQAYVQLSAFAPKILTHYQNKHGVDRVEVTDYAYNLEKADPDKGYIQVSFVEPYKENQDMDRPVSSFTKNHNVRQFMFTVRLTKLPNQSATASVTQCRSKPSEDLTQQWKRMTVFTTEASFPHLRCRLQVVETVHIDMSPIDVAIDAIQGKIQELMSSVLLVEETTPVATPATEADDRQSSASASRPSSKLFAELPEDSPLDKVARWNSPASSRGLQQQPNGHGGTGIPLLMDLYLQGALLAAVNAGPMAYAEAFLRFENQVLYPSDRVAKLKRLFLKFLSTCLVLLNRYRQLMSSMHVTKYQIMQETLSRYRVELSNLLKEEVVINEKLQVICLRSDLPQDP